MMPYGRYSSSLQLTGHADFWHPASAAAPRGDHRSLAKILSIASAPVVITGRIWWR